MCNILYLGNDRKILKNLEEWFQKEGPILHIELNPDHPFSEGMGQADVILLDCEPYTGVFPQELIDFPSMTFLDQTLLVLLIKTPLEQLPKPILQNSQIDLIPKPLQKLSTQKRVQQALLHAQHLSQLAQQTEELIERHHIIETAQSQILTSQKEKNSLLQQIHHRVKNNLQIVSSLLTLHSSNETDPRLEEILKNTQSRVDTISLIHKKLYESPNFAEIDMRDYVEQQISNIFNHFPSQAQHITLDFQSDSVQLDIDRAIHCALLINELVVNALRHAFVNQYSGQLAVHLKKSGETQLQLRITDNGIGLPSHLDLKQAQSIGFRLVYHLISQLGGTLDLDRESGTSFQIDFASA